MVAHIPLVFLLNFPLHTSWNFHLNPLSIANSCNKSSSWSSSSSMVLKVKVVVVLLVAWTNCLLVNWSFHLSILSTCELYTQKFHPETWTFYATEVSLDMISRSENITDTPQISPQHFLRCLFHYLGTLRDCFRGWSTDQKGICA